MTVGCWMVGLDERTSGWTDGRMTDGWMDGRMTDGWVDGWMDGWMDGYTLGVGSICLLSCHQPIHPFIPFIPSIDQRSKVKGLSVFLLLSVLSARWRCCSAVGCSSFVIRHSSFVVVPLSLFLCRCRSLLFAFVVCCSSVVCCSWAIRCCSWLLDLQSSETHLISFWLALRCCCSPLSTLFAVVRLSLLFSLRSFAVVPAAAAAAGLCL